MTRLLALLALLLSLVPPAIADNDTDVDGQQNGLLIQTQQAEHGHGPQATPIDSSQWTWHQETLCSAGACVGCPDNPGTPMIHIWATDEAGNHVYDWTGCPEEAPMTPQLTVGMIARAFQRIPLPASPLNIQPPNGRTLVNFDTNFYTEDQSFDRTVRLLGRRIDLHITVASYTWHFDDGEQLTTSKPGAPYPHLQITHSYLRTGDYAPTLDTTYVADYRVDGGAWQTVPGSVTIEGDPEQLTAIEARPVLVGYGSS